MNIDNSYRFTEEQFLKLLDTVKENVRRVIMDWQPIETAPKRTKLLLFSPPYGWNKFGEMGVGYIDPKYVGNPDYKWTHWMPLPEPPNNC